MTTNSKPELCVLCGHEEDWHKRSEKRHDFKPFVEDEILRSPELAAKRAQHRIWELWRTLTHKQDFGQASYQKFVAEIIQEEIERPAVPSAAPVVTDLAKRIRDILAEGERPAEGNPTSYIYWLQGKLLKIQKEVTQ